MFHLADFCRLCLNFKGEFSSMCNDNIMEKVVACISDLEFEDHLPALICMECLEKLDMFFDFRNRCLRSEFVLNSYLEKVLANTKAVFVNTKLQVNVLKDFTTTAKALTNVEIHKDKTLRKSLQSNKSHSSVNFSSSQGGAASTERNHDFDAYASDNVFSEDDDIFLEEEDEVQILQQKVTSDNSGIVTTKQSTNGSTVDYKNAKRKLHYCTSKKFKLNVSTPSNSNKFEILNPQAKSSKNPVNLQKDVSINESELESIPSDVLTDITERVKLRKRQVQLRAQAKNHCDLYEEFAHEDLSTKKHENKQKHIGVREVQTDTNSTRNQNNLEVIGQRTINRDPAPAVHMENSKIDKLNQSKENKAGTSNQEGDVNANIHRRKTENHLTKLSLIMGIPEIPTPHLVNIEKAIATTTDFENHIDMQRTEKLNELNKPQVTALNMGIPRIRSPHLVDLLETIPTTTDYEDSITTHHITPPKENINNGNGFEAKNLTYKSTQQLYQTNFGNLLKYHLTNKKVKENKNIPYKLVMSSKNKPVKIVVPTHIKPVQKLKKILPKISNVPAQTNELSEIGSSTNFSSNKNPPSNNIDYFTIPLVPLKTINKQSSILIGSTEHTTDINVVDVCTSMEDTQTILPTAPQHFCSVSVCDSYEYNSVEIDPFHNVQLNFEISYSPTENLPETSLRDIDETAEATAQCISQEIQSDSKETVNVKQEDKTSPSTSVIEEDVGIFENNIDVVTCTREHSYSLASSRLREILTSDDKINKLPHMKKVFHEKSNSNIGMNFSKSGDGSQHLKKLYNNVKKNTAIINKLLWTRKCKKKRGRTKREFVIDDPLNILKLFKHKPRKCKRRKKCKRKDNLWRKNGTTRKTPIINTNETVNNNLETDELPSTSNQVSYSDTNFINNIQQEEVSEEVNRSDSEDSEIDVVTVPEDRIKLIAEEENVIITPSTDHLIKERIARIEKRKLERIARNHKKKLERIARSEKKKLFKVLSNVIPKDMTEMQDSAPKREILHYATKYIKVLQSESQNLDKIHNDLLEKRANLYEALGSLDVKTCKT